MKNLLSLFLSCLLLIGNLHAQKSPEMFSSVFNDTIMNAITKKPVAPSFERSSRELNAFLKRASSNPRILNDTLFIYMKDFEDQMAAGKAQAVFGKNLVGEARKKYPGSTPRALKSRLMFYIEKRNRN